MKLKKLAKILGVLLALIIIALLALPMFISADYLKSQLIAQVKTATGRDLIIKGNTSLKVFPNIAVSAEEVTLGNPAGFSTPYFVQLKKLETGAALMPLLSKELRITGIKLEGANLNMEELGSGAKNWEFKSAPTEAEPAPKAEKSASSPLKALAIGDIVLKDSAVTMIKPGSKSVAKDINLTISGADGSSALKVDGSALYDNKKVKAKITADKMKALINGKPSPVEADITLPMGQVKFKGTASNDKALIIDGDAELAMDALKATGKLAVNLGGVVPSVKGALKIDELNLDKLSGGNKGEAKAEASAGQQGWSDEKIDFSPLRAANADLDITIGKLISGKLEISSIAAHVALSGGNMKLSLNNASLYSGTAKGTVTAESGGRIGTNIVFNGIEIEPLMTALVGNSRLEGKANATLAVNGTGNSQRAIVSSLAGDGSMRVVDGAFKGINIASFLRDAKKGFLAESSSEKTDFSELSATYKVAQGVVSNSDLSMKSPVLRVGGKGTVSLPAKTVDYRLEPTLVASLKGQGGKDKEGLMIPLTITGPWSNLSITPDLAGMLQEGLKDPAKLKENLKDIKGTIKDLNSPKDIGKALFGGGKTEPAPAPAPATAPATTTTPAAPAAAPAPAPAPAPKTEKQQKQEAIEQGIGGLLNSINQK